MPNTLNRRRFLQAASSAGLLTAVTGTTAAATPEKKYQQGVSPFPICFNTSTIRPASLRDKVRAASEAGYDALELWMNDLEKYEAEGGDLKALGAEIKDRGLFVIDVIGLWDCMPATEEAFNQSLELTRNRMRLAAAVGSKHVAALPLPDRENFDLTWGTARYRDLLRIGREEFGIIAAMEFVSLFKSVTRLGLASAIAIDANDKDARIIPDTFHMHKGGSGFEGIRHLNGNFIAVFHWNDVGPEPTPDKMGDADRIYPGDGVLPLKSVIQQLVGINYTGCLSLELFNREHWKIAETDPVQVAKTGLEKMRANVAAALG